MNSVIIAIIIFVSSLCQGKFYLVKTKEEMTRYEPKIGQDYDANVQCERGEVFSPKDGKCHKVFTKFIRASFGTKIKPR